MRAVVQRVTHARVCVQGQPVGAIERPGLLVFLAVTHGDDLDHVSRLARKVVDLRILRQERSVLDTGAAVLVVSQFTLYADTRKGRRPSWAAAAAGSVAAPLVDAFVQTDRTGVRTRGGDRPVRG